MSDKRDRSNVIYVDFKRKSRPPRFLGVVNQNAAVTADLSIPWSQNPYNTWDFFALLPELNRFQAMIQAAGYMPTVEMCRWGIPLHEAVSVLAGTAEMRAVGATTAKQLRAELNRLSSPTPGA